MCLPGNIHLGIPGGHAGPPLQHHSSNCFTQRVMGTQDDRRKRVDKATNVSWLDKRTKLPLTDEMDSRKKPLLQDDATAQYPVVLVEDGSLAGSNGG